MSQESGGYKFGAFKGVFLPSILTILGVIMYLRFGWVLGHLGLPLTLLVVTMATAITLLTGLSLAALATNMRVGGGGAYYIISRSLGVEAGAAVGLPLYLAQALSIAFYIAGFSESVCAVFPRFDPATVGVATLIILALLAWWSASFALKTQFLVLGLIAFSLVSFFTGAYAGHDTMAPASREWHALPFWVVFAVFFPAVTGIEAGIAMSGDLKNPSRALPLGTIGAVVVGYAIYLAIPVALHLTVDDRALLVSDPLIMRRVAYWGDFILYGVWAACLSSAMGSLLGAPRTLQALARDRVLPRMIGRGYGKGGDPRIATAISFAIALAGVLLGDLNLIAPVLSMFFLTSYALLNLSAGMENVIGAASWRPKFRIPGSLSLAGFAACLIVMLMINAGATLVAGLVTGGVYYMMKRRQMMERWGDLRQGIMLSLTRELLYRMAGRPAKARTWLPNILVLSGAPSRRWYLIELADAIAQNKGLLTVLSLVHESGWTPERAGALTESIRSHLASQDIRALVRVRPTDNIMEGARHVIRNYGFGPLIPNTILIGETEDPKNFNDFARIVQLVSASRRNLIIVREGVEREQGESPRSKEPGNGKAEKRVDVWWGGDPKNIGFMLALSCLLVRSPRWSGARLALKMIVPDEARREHAMAQLSEYVTEARIESFTGTEVLVSGDTDPFDVIRDASMDADMVFIGMREPEPEESPEAFSAYYAQLLVQTEDLPVTALVMSSENVPFQHIFGARDY